MNSPGSNRVLPRLSFLIRKSPDRRLFASFPELIAGYHVLHRLSMPRHPPYTLSSLTTFIDHRHLNLRSQMRDRKSQIPPGVVGRSPVALLPRADKRSIRRKGARRILSGQKDQNGTGLACVHRLK
jgi:hypothetical protein